jgi:myo-inositol-hexaphosphate 3-phosphohydrolase
MKAFQNIGIDDLNGGAYYVVVTWKQQDKGLWEVTDQGNGVVGYVCNRGVKSYSCHAWWEGCACGPIVAQASSFMGAIKEVCQWHYTANAEQFFAAGEGRAS